MKPHLRATGYHLLHDHTVLPATRQKWTHAPDRPVLDFPTPDGWNAELTYVTGYIPRWFIHPPIQVLTQQSLECIFWCILQYVWWTYDRRNNIYYFNLSWWAYLSFPIHISILLKDNVESGERECSDPQDLRQISATGEIIYYYIGLFNKWRLQLCTWHSGLRLSRLYIR